MNLLLKGVVLLCSTSLSSCQFPRPLVLGRSENTAVQFPASSQEQFPPEFYPHVKDSNYRETNGYQKNDRRPIVPNPPLSFRPNTAPQYNQFSDSGTDSYNQQLAGNRKPSGLSNAPAQSAPNVQNSNRNPSPISGQQTFNRPQESVSNNKKGSRPNVPTSNAEDFSNLGQEAEYQKTGLNVPIPERDSEDPRTYEPVSQFAWKLFKNSNTQTNFVLSPLSPQILLSYLAWVAEGPTRFEIKSANGYGSPKTLRRLTSSMLSEGKNRELQIATAFFVSEQMRLNEEFLKEALNNVDVINVDFTNAQKASRTITRWASQKTKNGLKLDKLEYSPATKIALTSAIYFKGNFIYKFQPAQPGIFYTPQQGPIKVPMMNMKRKFKWGEIGDFAQWAALPYESEDSLVIILPNQGHKLDEVIERMSDATFTDVLSRLDNDNANADVNITLPRFKIETTSNLVQPLNKMGIYNLFTPKADLPYLSDYEAVQVTNAQQQSSLEINEEGTVLISFTNFNVIALSFQPTIPDVEFNVDRPFLAIVADRSKGIPLVIAKVTNPLL